MQPYLGYNAILINARAQKLMLKFQMNRPGRNGGKAELGSFISAPAETLLGMK
jgi:hypothetical protein